MKTTIGIWWYDDPLQLKRTTDTIRMYTDGPYKVVLTTNKHDAAPSFFHKDLRNTPLLKIQSPKGAPGGFNRLITYDNADIVIFIESGSIVSPGWLNIIQNALNSDPLNGLAGPSTNRAWNEQRLNEGGKEEFQIKELEVFATQITQKYKNKFQTLEPLHSLADFCYAVKREVINVIGGADEGYGWGPCWEMDYNIRASRAGFKGVWASGAYVYRMPPLRVRMLEEYRKIEANKKRYQDKFCRLKLERRRQDYCNHCKGDACEFFAPKDLIQIRIPFDKDKKHITERTKVTSSPKPTRLRPHSNKTESQLKKADTHKPKLKTTDIPLVSCIMPTCDRNSFVSQAITYFLRQDYPKMELIIVDDGTEPFKGLLPPNSDIRYIRLKSKRTIGAKRNLACQEAKGEIIVHWDDDDWMAPYRIKYQVESLKKEGADICGLDKLIFYNAQTDQSWQYIYPQTNKPWLAGGSLCYTKAFWEKNPFPEINNGEDTQFIWSNCPKKMITLSDNSFYIALIHSGNTSPKRTQDNWWHSFSSDEVKNLMGEDWHFYREPLVSCIMPTNNRRHFVPLAVKYFLNQNYPNRELIIVDDGADKVSDIVPKKPNIHYIRLSKRESIGTKRNIAVEAASGEFIVHWDDDDWYAANRLTAQIQKLIQDKVDVTALSMRYILHLPTMEFWRCSHELHSYLHYNDMCCGTIAYRRSLWEQFGPYPSINCCEDVLFLKALPCSTNQLCRLADEELFICVRHGQNTWSLAKDWECQPQDWQKVTIPQFFSSEEYQEYENLTQQRRHCLQKSY